MLGLRKKSFAFGSPRYQRMKTPVSARARSRFSQAGLLISGLYLTEKFSWGLFSAVWGAHICLAQVRQEGFSVRDVFSPAPHAKAQLFRKQSISQLQTLY